MIEIGKKQILKIDSENQAGYHLVCSDDQEVFLPGSLATPGIKVGDDIEVFVYTNNEGDQLATCNLPFASVNEFAYLEVKDTTPFGAFLDMGLPKDLFVPQKLQRHPMRSGQKHLVYILLDSERLQLVGTEKFEKFIQTKNIPLRSGQAVKIMPFYKTPLGYKVLIENKFHGMIYHNEIFAPVQLGQEYEGAIKSINIGGTIDALINKTGIDGIEANCKKILELLHKNQGRLNLSDRSSPEEITKLVQLSKKAFKNAIGVLYKKREITIHEDYIEIHEKPKGVVIRK